MTRPRKLFLGGIVALVICVAGLFIDVARRDPAGAGDKLVFNESIEPILSENCYPCHGPDPGARKDGLRLDRPEFAFAPHGKSGPAIVRGDPDHSPLVLRVESKDDKRRMPPREAHTTLDSVQVATLRRWVKEGAGYQEHWAFIPPKSPAIPSTRRTGWARNPIDQFILARLERERLEPSPEADRPTLIRRVTYDLTGLPPTPEEVEAFLEDPSPDAYERVVDRLLASPRYGEHRAHYWLDAARYADTHGLHIDNYRSVWPYRDYVIRSYNENKPYDQFTREQLAGDLLPPVSADQIVATAFVRAGISTGEDGTIPEELRFNLERERMETFGAVYMGMTTGCAVCHDHKFDPTTQKDVYRLAAFFNNLDEIPSNRDSADWPPNIRVPKPENREAYDAALALQAGIRRQMDARRAQERALIPAWLDGGPDRPRAVSGEGLAVRLRFDEGRGSSVANSAPGPDPKLATTTGAAPAWGEETWFWPTFRMESNTRLELPGAGDFEANQPFSVGTWVMPRLKAFRDHPPQVGAIVGRVDSTRESRGWELYDDHDRLSFRLIHRWPDAAIVVTTGSPVFAGGRWSHVFATYDGSGKAAGVRLYVDGALQEATVAMDTLAGGARTTAPLTFGAESPDANPLRELRFQDFRLYARELSADEAPRVAYEDPVAEVVRMPIGRWTGDEFKLVSDFYFARVDAPTRALGARSDLLQADLDRLSKDGDICLVCRESSRMAYSDVLARGVYTQRLERVRPGVPHFLPQLPAGAPLNRLSLADWVVSAENPLTARVAANRMWQEVFGTGIVETTEDFGLVGGRPSHPQLLDWLAVDFRGSGWNVKRFYKQLVMSATYRQSAGVTPGLVERDPGNRLLARGPRFRMDAEMIRDTALAASGLLVERIGGPSVKPYQPAGIWESGGFMAPPGVNTALVYVTDHGDSLYRRSVYTFWKRMATMPDMDTFDYPVRDGSCTRRQRTNTPLQSLVTMNDPQWLEAARRLGERLILGSATTDGRLDYLGRLVLARPWRPGEKAVLKAEYEKFRATCAGDPAAASKLVRVGESQPDGTIAPADLAPWMLVASTALNLDAALNK